MKFRHLVCVLAFSLTSINLSAKTQNLLAGCMAPNGNSAPTACEGPADYIKGPLKRSTWMVNSMLLKEFKKNTSVNADKGLLGILANSVGQYEYRLSKRVLRSVGECSSDLIGLGAEELNVILQNKKISKKERQQQVQRLFDKVSMREALYKSPRATMGLLQITLGFESMEVSDLFGIDSVPQHCSGFTKGYMKTSTNEKGKIVEKWVEHEGGSVEYVRQVICHFAKKEGLAMPLRCGYLD